LHIAREQRRRRCIAARLDDLPLDAFFCEIAAIDRDEIIAKTRSQGRHGDFHGVGGLGRHGNEKRKPGGGQHRLHPITRHFFPPTLFSLPRHFYGAPHVFPRRRPFDVLHQFGQGYDGER